jgi:short subunit dehydrogenase
VWQLRTLAGSAARPRSVRAAAWSGVIVNVSSISADGGYPYTSVYQASKAAVAALTEGLHAELAQFGVVVKALHPGSMQTRIFSKVDRAQNPPEEYRASWNNFASLNLVRSDPAITVDVMFRMVTDGNTRKVHYYSGPRRRGHPASQATAWTRLVPRRTRRQKPRRIHPALDGIDATPPVTAVPNRVVTRWRNSPIPPHAGIVDALTQARPRPSLAVGSRRRRQSWCGSSDHARTAVTSSASCVGTASERQVISSIRRSR